VLIGDFLDPIADVEKGPSTASGGRFRRPGLTSSRIFDPNRETFPFSGAPNFMIRKPASAMFVGRAEQYRQEYHDRSCGVCARPSLLCPGSTGRS